MGPCTNCGLPFLAGEMAIIVGHVEDSPYRVGHTRVVYDMGHTHNTIQCEARLLAIAADKREAEAKING